MHLGVRGSAVVALNERAEHCSEAQWRIEPRWGEPAQELAP
jgi:hypothetical protein